MGQRSGLTQSLRFRLSLWLSVTVLLVGLVSAGLSFVIAFHAANEVQNNLLSQTAALVGQSDLLARDRDSAHGSSKIEFEDRILIRRLKPAARRYRRPHFSARLTPGFHTVDAPNGPYRLIVRRLSDGIKVAVAQQTAVRNETAIRSALTAMFPNIIALLALLGVLMWLVYRLFQPVSRVANALDERDETDLSHVESYDLPAELWPFLAAFNRLLTRIETLMIAQRRFVAAAAHELRTPMASLALQAERLERNHRQGSINRDDIVSLRRGIDRHRRIVDQLLTLSRSQADLGSSAAACDLNDVIRDVIADLMPLISERQIELIFSSETEPVVYIARDDLVSALANVLSNAVKYNVEQGRILLRVRTTSCHAVIEIEDDGPGLADDQRQYAIDPFFRGEVDEQTGSGLGLTIVHEIVRKWSGELELGESSVAAGLWLCITLPADDEPAAGRAVPVNTHESSKGL